MSRLREKHDRLDVFSENELRVGFAVEEEIKLIVGVCFDDTAKAFAGDPSDAFELVFQQQTSIYSYFHADSFCKNTTKTVSCQEKNS